MSQQQVTGGLGRRLARLEHRLDRLELARQFEHASLKTRINGAGKAELVAVWDDGSETIVATQP